MENFYARVPLQIRIYDIFSRAVEKTYVILGETPKYIISDILAAYRAYASGGKIRSDVLKSLNEYYGGSALEKLALVAPKLGGADITEDEIARMLKDMDAVDTGRGDIDRGDIDREDSREKTRTPLKSTNTLGDMSDRANNIAPRMIGKPTTRGPPPVEYVTDCVFSEDRWDDFREKIYMITGVRVYEQHVFYYSNGRPKPFYKMFIRGNINIDITDMKTGYSIAGIDIDKMIYDYREDVKIEAFDAFNILGTNPGPFYVVNLAGVLSARFSQLKSISGDTYQLDLLYYGFILKYFPIVTREIFSDIIAGRYSDIGLKYPLLNISIDAVRAKFAKQAEILNNNYNMLSRGTKLSTNVLFSINSAQTIHYAKTIINLRNLFDLMQTSAQIPEIHAYLRNDISSYFVRKKHSRAGEIKFPPIAVMSDGLILAISLYKEDQDTYHARKLGNSLDEQSRFLYFNIKSNGVYSVRGVFTEEDKMDFDKFENRVREVINPIIAKINAFGKFVFGDAQLEPISVVEYKSLNVTIYWKRFISSGGYKILKKYLDKYYSAGIMSYRSVKIINAYEFLFHSGMHEFDPEVLEKTVTAAGGNFNNSYAHFTDSIVSQKWDNQYMGKVVKLFHRNSDVAAEIVNVRRDEFIIFATHMHILFTELERDKNLRIGNIDMNSKKIKKLREQDPELYNLRKYGSKKIYSIICQNQHQPLIVNDTIDSMTEAERARVIKYWNFTLGKPAYYYCPNSKYPHLSFITGEHPRKYCLPCCRKIEAKLDSSKTKTNAECLKNKVYEPPAREGEHILLYSTDIMPGRFAYLPEIIYDVFGIDINEKIGNGLISSIEKTKYFLYGVQQKFMTTAGVGAIYSILYLLNKTIARVLADVRDFFSKHDKPREVFLNLLNGTAYEYFESHAAMIAACTDIFVLEKIFTINTKSAFSRWKDLFIELVYLVYGYNIYIIEDDSGTCKLYMPEYITNTIISDHINGVVNQRQNIVLFVVGAHTYPFVRVQKISKDNYDIKKLFNTKSETAGGIVATMNEIIIGEYFAARDDAILDYILVRGFCKKKSKYELVCKLINKSNLCYCVIVRVVGKNNRFIYMNINYSNNISDGVELVYDVVPRDRYHCEFDDAIDFINAINDYIANESLRYMPLVIESIMALDGKIIGIMLDNNLAAYITDTDAVPTMTRKNITKDEKKTPDDIARIRDGRDLRVPYQISKYVSVHTDNKVSDVIPIKKIMHDYTTVNTLILSRAGPKPDPTITGLGRAFYTNYLYHLVVIEFMNYISSNRNDQLREKLGAIIANSKFNTSAAISECKKQLATVVGQIDYIGVVGILNDILDSGRVTDKPEAIAGVFKKKISERKFDFDNVIIEKLTNMRPEERTQELLRIFDNIITVDKLPGNLNFQNMFIPCSNSDIEYCRSKKLIIESRDSVREYAQLLSHDLGDNLTLKYIMNYNIDMKFINFLNFRENTNEILEVNKLNIIKS